jgi:hypothetical protein
MVAMSVVELAATGSVSTRRFHTFEAGNSGQAAVGGGGGGGGARVGAGVATTRGVRTGVGAGVGAGVGFAVGRCVAGGGVADRAGSGWVLGGDDAPTGAAAGVPGAALVVACGVAA